MREIIPHGRPSPQGLLNPLGPPFIVATKGGPVSFYDTPLRRLCLVRAVGCLVLGAGIFVLLWLPSVDATGKQFVLIMEGGWSLGAIYNFWRWRRASPQAVVTMMPDRAPVPVQFRYYRGVMWVGIIAFS